MKSKAVPLSITLFWVLLLIATFSQPSEAVKHYLFKTCDQNAFCKRNRHIADTVQSLGPKWESPYQLEKASVDISSNGTISGKILKKSPTGFVHLPFIISLYDDDIVRFQMDELKRQDGNSIQLENPNLKKRRYNDLDKWVIDPKLISSQGAFKSVEQKDEDLKLTFGKDAKNYVIIQPKPFSIKFYKDGELQIVFNDRGLLNMEHWRPKPKTVIKKEGEETKEEVEKDAELDTYELDEGRWEDSFDGKSDKKVRGPESLAVDISFVGYKHVYGIPEHADSMSLRGTRGQEEGDYKDPYRLFNVDIFEYEINSPMAMYGSIPFMQAHKQGGKSVGVYWNNAADTYVDIVKTGEVNAASGEGEQKVLEKNEKSVQTHWISESGIMDVFVMLGSSPSEINKLYGKVTGYAKLPQLFSIGHHQCRWNYNDEDDVLQVNSNFDKHGIPYDVIWLDIEYTDDKKYFTWNTKNFPHYEDMMKQLDASKRKLVTIIDPHIKAVKGYKVYDVLESKNLAIQNKEGKPYHGHCWPGESIWIDTLNPEAREFWSVWYNRDQLWAGKATNLHIWNDMNEPSVFSGPETTIDKNTIHYGGWEHRDVHNIYGMTVHNATVDALDKRYDYEQRPFVLTRAYFAGSQRSAAMWTGDNMAKWEYLKIATPMILTSGIAGMPFAGADVGGFFGNPSPELLTRWYQAGLFYPFFRAHAHIDSKRREPWLIGEPYTNIIRDAIQLRYRLLPTFYNAFYEASVNGAPIMKPIYYIAPENEAAFSVDDEFFVGDSGILVKPVTDEGATHVDIYIPDEEIYYNYENSHKIYNGVGYHQVAAPLEKIPYLMRGGHIHARKDRVRRSATLMKYDPYTLVIGVSKEGKAQGSLYIDDGESYGYKDGQFIKPSFTFDLSSKKIENQVEDDDVDTSTPYLDSLWVEKIEIFVDEKHGGSFTKALVTEDGKSWEVAVKKQANGKIVVQGPKVHLSKDWVIELL